MKTRLFTLIMALLCSSNAWSYFKVGQLYYENSPESTDAVYVLDCEDTVTTVTIPETVRIFAQDFRVVAIGENAFSNCSKLQSVSMPSGITTIGDYAFYNCTALTDIILTDSVKSLGKSAFYNCSALKELTLPASVKSIGEEALYGCKSLTTLRIMEGLDSIGQFAFWQCYALTDIHVSPDNPTFSSENGILYDKHKTTLLKHAAARPDTVFTVPASVTRLGECAFEDCQALTSVILPPGLTYIGRRAFSYCQKLSRLNIPENLQEIDSEAFWNCQSLTSLTLPEGLTHIGSHAFLYCSGLTSIHLPEALARIEPYTFNGCASLTHINLPKGLTEIPQYAFAYCQSLQFICIPAGVTSIGETAFRNCEGLDSIRCEAVTPPQVSGYDTFFGIPKDIPVYVPRESIEQYQSAPEWSNFTNYQGFLTAIPSVEAGNISVSQGTLRNPQGLPLKIYDMSGRQVYQGSGHTVNLPKGIYVVRCGEQTLKAAF